MGKLNLWLFFFIFYLVGGILGVIFYVLGGILSGLLIVSVVFNVFIIEGSFSYYVGSRYVVGN